MSLGAAWERYRATREQDRGPCSGLRLVFAHAPCPLLALNIRAYVTWVRGQETCHADPMRGKYRRAYQPYGVRGYHEQLLENVRRKGLLPRHRHDQSICLLGRLFCLVLCGCCLVAVYRNFPEKSISMGENIACKFLKRRHLSSTSFPRTSVLGRVCCSLCYPTVALLP
jgi:hypothetical protein